MNDEFEKIYIATNVELFTTPEPPLRRRLRVTMHYSWMVGLIVAACIGSNPASGDQHTADTPTRREPGLVLRKSMMRESLPALDSATSADKKGLGLSVAIGMAVARHPNISRAHAAVLQSQAEVAVAESARYPTLDYSVQPGYGGGYANSGSSAGMRTSIGVNQLLYDFGRTSSRVSAAEATLRKQQHLVGDAKETVAYDTATTYIELASSQAMVDAAQQQLAAQKKTYVKIRDRVKAGFSDASDLYQADMAIQRAQAEIFQAKTRFGVAAGRMAELTGVLPEQVASMEETRNQIVRLGATGDNTDTTPAVLAAKAELETAEAKVRQAEAERYPSIGVGINRSDTMGQANASDNTWIGLSLKGSFPLSGLSQHQIDAAKAARLAAAEALENQKLISRTAFKSALNESSGATARMDTHSEVIRLANSSRDVYWQEYTLNKRSLTDVVNVEREIYSSQVERINAMADGTLAMVKAYVATGTFAEAFMPGKSAAQ